MDVKTQSTLARLFDGWPAGAVVVGIAVLLAWIVIPVAGVPNDVPLPIPDQRVLARISALDAQRAANATANPLPHDVRALGEAVRRYGLTDNQGNAEQASHALSLLNQANPAGRVPDEQLLSLRALQLSIFLTELSMFERTGNESDALKELGGSFVATALRTRWMKPNAAGFSFMPNRYVREALFRKRWNEITSLKRPPFALSVDEERVLYAFMISHPVVSVPAEVTGNPVYRCRSAHEYQLKKVKELSGIDPAYPSDYAMGVVLLQMDRPKEAMDFLGRYLDQHPNGPWILRTRNAFREAKDRVDAMQLP